MRWSPLARQECQSLLESRGVWLLAAILPLWSYRAKYATGSVLGPDMTIGYLQHGATLILPLAVILLCYRSVVGERESGSLKFLLGLPLTRRDVFVGKFVGRTAGIVVPILAGLGIVTIVGALQHGFFSPLRYLAVLGATVIYVVALVSIVVSVSAIAKRSVTAAGTLVIGLLVGLEFLWNAAVSSIVSAGQNIGLISESATEGVTLFLLRLSPSGAYNVVTNWILDIGNSTYTHTQIARDIQSTGSSSYVVESSFEAGEVPLYLTEVGGLLVLVAWVVIPLLVASSVFARGDLA